MASYFSFYDQYIPPPPPPPKCPTCRFSLILLDLISVMICVNSIFDAVHYVFTLISSLGLQEYGFWCRMISNGGNTWAWQCTFRFYKHWVFLCHLNSTRADPSFCGWFVGYVASWFWRSTIPRCSVISEHRIFELCIGARIEVDVFTCTLQHSAVCIR
jgi:hypothetical protein